MGVFIHALDTIDQRLYVGWFKLIPFGWFLSSSV